MAREINYEKEQLNEQKSIDTWLAINTIATIGSFVFTLISAFLLWKK